MARDAQVQVRIVGTDEVSPVVAKVRAGLDRLTSGSILPGVDLRGVMRGHEQVIGSVQRRVQSLNNLSPGIGLLGGAGTVAGIGAMVSSFATAGTSLANTAQLAGTSANRLNSLRGAAERVGVDASTADQAMMGLNHTLSAAVFGRDNQAANLLMHRWGENIGNVRDGAKTAEEVLPRVVRRLREMADVSPRAALQAMEILHIPASFLPVVMQGADALEASRLAIERLNPITRRGIWESQQFTAAQADLAAAFRGVRDQIVVGLAPTLVPMLEHLAGWVSGNGPKIGETFASIGRGIGAINWREVGEGVEAAGRRAHDAAEEFDYWMQKIRGVRTTLDQPFKVVMDNIPTALRPGSTTPTMDESGLAGGIGVSPAPSMYSSFDDVRNRQATSFHQNLYDNNSWYRAYQNWVYGHRSGNPGGVSARGSQDAPSGSNSRAVSESVPPEGRAFLDAVAPGESGGRYDAQNQSSGAYGRYQFLRSTWREVAAQTGLHDTTPENQDRNAWFYAQQMYRRNTGRDLGTDLRAGRDPSSGLNRIWTSLPGGAEPNAATGSFGSRLSANLSRPASQPSQPRPTPEPAPEEPDLTRGGRVPMPARPTPPPEQPDPTRAGRLPALMAPPPASAPQATTNTNTTSTVRLMLNVEGMLEGMKARAYSDNPDLDYGMNIRYAMPDSGRTPPPIATGR